MIWQIRRPEPVIAKIAVIPLAAKIAQIAIARPGKALKAAARGADQLISPRKDHCIGMPETPGATRR